jgi:hypothetical protein
MTTWRFYTPDGDEIQTRFDGCSVGAAGELQLGGVLADGLPHALDIIAPGYWTRATFGDERPAAEVVPIRPESDAPHIPGSNVAVTVGEPGDGIDMTPPGNRRPPTDVARRAIEERWPPLPSRALRGIEETMPRQCLAEVGAYHCLNDAAPGSEFCVVHDPTGATPPDAA